jgi:hypothetical protein
MNPLLSTRRCLQFSRAQFTHWSLGTLSFENEVTEFPKAKSKLLHQAGLSKVPPKTMAYKNNISIRRNKLIDTVSHLAWA